MASERLFGASIAPACKYCEHVMQSFDGGKMLCDKRGVVEASYKCRRFIYDPLKREPRKPLSIEKIDESEFEL